MLLKRGAYVLHFWEKVNEKFMVILMRKNCVIIRNFAVQLSLYYRIKLFVMNKIALIEQDNIAENNKKIATVLNEFFSNIITTLGIPQYIEEEPVSQNIDDLLMKAIITV